MAELRHVKTLRLAASRREQVMRTRVALEDALRTASLPQLPRGAIMLVRRLSLGRLPADASPQWLSRHIEARLRGLQSTPVRVRRDDGAAPAVWFADRSEALALLLATSLDGDARAWYWAGVLPGWRPGMKLAELLPLALRQAASETETVTQAPGVAALLDRLLRLQCLDQVLDHLEPAHVPSLPAPPNPLDTTAGLARFTDPTDAPAGVLHKTRQDEVIAEHAQPFSTPIVSETWRAVLTRWLRQWRAADRRSRWLATHALVAVHGPAAATHADRLIASLTGPAPRHDRIESRAERPVGSTARATSCTPGHDLPLERPRFEKHKQPHAPSSADATAQAARRRAAHELPADALPPTAPDWQPSGHAGLLLVLPALARLEIAKADAEGDLCLCVLHRIADRLRIRKDDPIRQALPNPLPPSERREFAPPAAWAGLARLPRRIDLGREDGLLAACQLVLARYLRRYARISLRRLVRRPALVHATRTHIDLRFDARWVDLDLRRAGLDLDPGWVPWLGRVVSFHYDYEGQS